MIKIDDEDIKSNHALFLKAYKDAVNVPLTQEGFMRKTFPKLAEKANRTYPYEVRIPKSISEMLAGDFEPARVILLLSLYKVRGRQFGLVMRQMVFICVLGM